VESPYDPRVEQAVRFTDIGDKRLAYATVGSGKPMLLSAGWVGNLAVEWEDPSRRAFLEALGATHTVIRYDRFGSGQSDRVTDSRQATVEREVEVLEALAEHLELEPCTLFGFSFGGPLAIAFAARNPARVDRLILYGSYADGSRIASPEVQESMGAMVRAHWGLGARLLTEIFIPDGDRDEASSLERFQREAASAETAAGLLELVYRTDVEPLLDRIDAPTLVAHRRDDRAIPFQLGRELAAGIHGAQFVPLSGRWHLPWLGDVGALLRAISDFLGIAVAQLGAQRPRSRDREAAGLSERETEILTLVAEGLRDAEIAERLTLSPHTVHRHVANIRTKLRQPSRAAAAAHAARLGLI